MKQIFFCSFSKKITFVIIALASSNLAGAQGIVTINPEFFHLDTSKKLILINAPGAQLPTPGDTVRALATGSHRYTLAAPATSLSPRQAYRVTEGSSTYTAYFTRIPVIQLATKHPIVDTPGVYATFSLTDTSGVTTRSGLEIELRGGYSQTASKKSYELSLLADTVAAKGQDIALLGMRSDNKWNLQAMYNDPLRLRLKTANELWLDMHQIYYKAQEPNAKNGISLVYTEVFLNDQYQGLYALTERVDRKQLKLKKYTTKIQGELYKGVDWADGTVTFDAVPDYDNNSLLWGGFEYKEPSEQTDWKSLHDFVDFVERSPDSTFYSQYKTRFNLESAVDYFIFLNLMRATDNTGKNLYIAKYKPNEPYYYVPWDLDGVLGNDWQGLNTNVTDDILTNGMYKRLLKDGGDTEFGVALARRWAALRGTVLTQEAILSKLTRNSNYLLANNVYEREHLAWPAYRYQAAQLAYPATWLASRLAYLDSFFRPRVGTELATRSSAGAAPLQLYPNPASGELNLAFGAGPYQVAVQDMSGRTLLQASVAGGHHRLAIGTLAPGLYLVRAKSAAATAVQKLVVE